MKSKTKRKAASAMISAGAALVLLAASLLAYNQWDDGRAYRVSLQAADAFTARLSAGGAPSSGGAPGAPAADAGEPYFMLNGKAYIGLIDLPTLNIRLPVLSAWSNPNMKIAPCRYFGSAAGGDMVILAHDYNRFFGYIHTLSPGDPVIFTDAAGVEHDYAVALVTVLAPTAVSQMTDSGYPLTLFTCTYGGKSRVTVRCVKAGDNQ